MKILNIIVVEMKPKENFLLWEVKYLLQIVSKVITFWPFPPSNHLLYLIVHPLNFIINTLIKLLNPQQEDLTIKVRN